jgi:uncharacterized cupin superfamily protein
MLASHHVRRRYRVAGPAPEIGEPAAYDGLVVIFYALPLDQLSNGHSTLMKGSLTIQANLHHRLYPLETRRTVSNQARELLKATEIDAMEPRRSVHPLNERAVRFKKSLSEMTGLTQFGFHLVTLQPGHDSTEYHRHLYEEECIYILSGNGEALIDNHVHEVGPGDFMGFARGGAAHTLSNTGHLPLVLIVAGQRLEQDVCDYPHKGKRLYAAGTNKVFVDLPKDSED